MANDPDLTRRYAELLAAAREVSVRAHAPYSGFRVGAAVLTTDGTVILGCNVESASYGLTTCAERVALASAIAQGHRSFEAIALWSRGPLNTPCCGACRQWLAEHLPADAPVLKATPEGSGAWRVRDLLPDPFLDVPD